MHEGKVAVGGLGGTPTTQQTQCLLRRKRQRRWMMRKAWEGGLVKYCSPCRSHLLMITARKKIEEESKVDKLGDCRYKM